MTDDHLARELAAVRERLTDLETELADLREHVAQERATDRQRLADIEDGIENLRRVVAPRPEDKPFAEFSHPEKVRYLRDHLRRRAEWHDGPVAVDYKEVHALFQDEFVRSHSYDLMDAAAEAEAFEYGEIGQSDRKRLVYTNSAESGRVKTESTDSRVKND